MNQPTIQRKIMRCLEAWPGFQAVKTALVDVPGLEVYLSGGAIRDVLLGNRRPIKDFDLFVDGPRVDRFFQRLETAGRMESNPYGSPRWFPAPDGAPYADLIPVRRFSNGLWQCRNILDVLNQFDCTVNAAAIDLRTGAFLDPQNACRDAARRMMHAIRLDLPATPVRPGARVTHAGGLWHRLIHYACSLGLEIEPQTARWLLEHRPPQAESRRFSELFFVPRLSRWPATGAVGAK
jgi:hypothetical protein